MYFIASTWQKDTTENGFCEHQEIAQHHLQTSSNQPLIFMSIRKKILLVSSYCTKNISDENVKSAGLKLFFTCKPRKSTLQALLLSHYKLVSGHLMQYLSGMMKVSHCFSYLNNFPDFR